MTEAITSAAGIRRAFDRCVCKGTLIEAELFPLGGRGRLRSHQFHFFEGGTLSEYGCDPDDQSPYVWWFVKTDDGLSLEPPDDTALILSYLTLEPEDLLITKFRLYDGRYMGVGPWGAIAQADPPPWPCYPMQWLPASETDPRAILWFVAVHRTNVPGLQVPLRDTLTADHIRNAYANAGLSASEEEVSRLAAQIGVSR